MMAKVRIMFLGKMDAVVNAIGNTVLGLATRGGIDLGSVTHFHSLADSPSRKQWPTLVWFFRWIPVQQIRC